MPPGPGIHPRDTFRPTSSIAEQAIWGALQKHMPLGWYGWHSLRIRDPHGYEGEGDFILAHPERGFLVLEVKGGQVEQRDGRWFQNGEPMPKAPLEQGTGFAKKLSLRLRDVDCSAPAYGAAVCFPDTYVGAQPSQDNLDGLVIGKGELPYLTDALPPLLTRALPEGRPARGHWIDAIHRFWGETWIPSLALGTRAKEATDQRLGLDQTQVEVLDGLLENDRALVQGGAGSGKTLIAAEAARRLAAAGQKVLLLCFTVPLQKWLSTRLDGTGVDVVTVSGLAKRLVDASGTAPLAPVITGVDAWGELFGRAADLCERTWDIVIVDEAQDLQFEAWVLVSSLAEGKRLFAFHDPGQGFWADRKPPRDLFKAFYPLPRQLRGPPGVRALSDKILGKPFDADALAAARGDGTIGVVVAPSLTSVPDKIGAEVDRLLSAGLDVGQIGIVSLRGQLAEGTIPGRAQVGRHPIVRADDPAMETRLVADTFLRWKGLERPAIIVADLPEAELGQMAIRLNVAVTRAMAFVRFVGTATSLHVGGISPE